MAPKKAKVDPKQEAARLVIEERLVLEAKLDDEEVARIKIEKRLVPLAQKADREAAAAEKAEKERREAERLRIEAERVARRLKLEAGLVSEAQQADAAIEAAIEAERLEQERQDLAALRSALGDAELVLTWDGDAVPSDWLRGLSEYTWHIPPNRDAGDHEIVVSLKDSNCTLLRLTVTVASDRTQMIVVGSIAGAAILAIAVIGFLAWKNRDRAKEMIFSLLSYEGVLTGELCFETW
jgi:hypothetical protein